MFVWLCWYFYTGYGGPIELVANLVPIALMLQILHMHKNGYHLQAAAADRESIIVIIYLGICLLRLLPFSHGIRADLDLAAGLLYPGGLHHGSAGFPPGDGALADRPYGAVLDERGSGGLHALGLSEPDRFLLASGDLLLPGDHLEHRRTLDRHLRAIRPDRADDDRGVSAPGGGGARLRRPGSDGQFHAADRRKVAAHDPPDGRPRLVRGRHDQRQRRGQRHGGRRFHDPADETLRRAGGVRRGGGDRGFDGRAHHAAGDGGRRFRDGGIPRRLLLERGAPRLRPRLHLLLHALPVRLSAEREADALHADREDDHADLRTAQDGDLLPRDHLSHHPDGGAQLWRAARGALYRGLHVRAPHPALSLFQVRAEGPGGGKGCRSSRTSAS